MTGIPETRSFKKLNEKSDFPDAAVSTVARPRPGTSPAHLPKIWAGRGQGGEGGDSPTPPPLFLWRGSPPHPCAGPGGYPPPPQVPAGACHTNAKNRPHHHLTTAIPREAMVLVVQEKRVFRHKGGRGVIPLPPLFFFFVEGITPPPMCRAWWGVPPLPTISRPGWFFPGIISSGSERFRKIIRIIIQHL